MPAIFVPRLVIENPYIFRGTQYLGDNVQLTFAGATTIVLSNDIYYATGDYILFDYSAPGATFPGGQAELDANVFPYFDDSALGLSGVSAVTDDPVNERIILSLGSNPTNGTQYIASGKTLDISSPMTIYLSAELYATPNTYILFDWTAGGSFVGSASNINAISLKGLTAGTPFVDGTQIKVTLS